jgi:hypothetical protein
MEPNVSHAANSGVLKYLGRHAPSDLPATRSPGSVKHPYYSLGSHPDIVERLWDQLQTVLPVDCRCIVFGAPALVHPDGIVLAVALGTGYALRVSKDLVDVALRRGAKTLTRYAGGTELDLPREFGDGWIFGGWFSEELTWCRVTYEAYSISR